MPKVVCAVLECKYNSDDNTCNAPKIFLSDHNIMTLHDGRQQFMKCKQYEESEITKQINEIISKCMKEYHPLMPLTKRQFEYYKNSGWLTERDGDWYFNHQKIVIVSNKCKITEEP